MASSPVLKPHIDPDGDGTFDSHYHPRAEVDALIADKADQTALDTANAILASKAAQTDLDLTNANVASAATVATNVTFNADGTITAAPAGGAVQTVTFNADGTITTAYGAPLSTAITTTFSPDGSITESTA